MKTLVLLVAALLLAPQASFAGAFGNRPVEALIPPDHRPCVMFKLQGIPSADVNVAGQPWFAIPNTADGYREIYALLLLSKISGTLLYVVTDGTTVCGFPKVVQVQAP